MAGDEAAGGSEAEKPSVIRPTDADSIKQARRLVHEARFGAISVLEPETGHPFASRVLVGTDFDGVPVILASMLTTHMKAIIADPRCSLLLGEPGRGDPLAWPRVTVLCAAEKIDLDGESDARIRTRFLKRHPKAKLYASFRDFSFFRLVPKRVSLNAGFGRAYNISGDELIIDSPFNHEICTHEEHFVAEMEKLGCNVPDLLAKHYFSEKTGNWYISGIDADGVDLARKETIHRLKFVNRVTDSNGLIAEYSKLLMELPKN
jgi:putative heme iron utilization protein